MALLVFAALLWLGMHIGVSGTALRGVLAGPVSPNAFRGIYSLVSLVAIALLIWGYRRAATVPLWALPLWAYWILALLMLPAFLLFAASTTPSNPIAGRKLSADGPRGIIRVTRHPMLCGFTIWALVHVLGNGDLASLIFFGTFGLTAVAGMPSIDRKVASRDPAGWASLRAGTSILPFGAILAGRNSFVASEIAWYVWAIGAVLWAAMLHFHRYIIGVSPLPM